MNLFLLRAIPQDALNKKAEKSKAPEGHFRHIHNVRLMWIKEAAPEFLPGLDKLESTDASDIESGLMASASAIRTLLDQCYDSGVVKGFKPHTSAFLGYLISHESFHRSQIELVLRQVGNPLDDKVAYGLWEWGSRQKEILSRS